METLKTHDWKLTAVCSLFAALVTLVASTQMHVSNEVSRPELQADVSAAVAPFISKVGNMEEEMHSYHVADSLAIQDIINRRVKVTWSYNAR